MYLRVKPLSRRTLNEGQGSVEGAGSYVELSAPARISDRGIADFVGQRADWIHAQERRLATMMEGPEAGGCRDFEWTPERRAQAQAHIEAKLPDLLARWGAVVGRRPSHITLRVMTSRWGSCTPRTGRIRLNLQLGLMDERFLEYVLVHELTHLWENGHGPGFQARMDSYLPGWRQLRRELNQQMVW
ncbi:metal-dependent hydrolase [Bifidobacterium aemilianum]|uniref:Metal-dependent hydrolase n=1 Tax=Bifidobacterium aemilianum TaxID=2493120 RepID=A0A366K8G6_9BIFI|nr:metal-dependent hydrolase [Bifidobacterium aemilianum]